MTIAAIETTYAGHHFRSRLEARWAVVFERLGLQYEYEPEGFKTSAGGYLPDFRLRLPEGDWWFEVKPETGWEEDARWTELVKGSGVPLVVSKGIDEDLVSYIPTPCQSFTAARLTELLQEIPGDDHYEIRGIGFDESERAYSEGKCRATQLVCQGLKGMVAELGAVRLTACDHGHSLLRVTLSHVPGNDIVTVSKRFARCGQCRTVGFHYKCLCGGTREGSVRAAFDDARSARFEHGQTPSTGVRGRIGEDDPSERRLVRI